MGSLPLPVLLALFCVWICWGATYAGMHAATASFPPFVMSAIRFGTSGVLIAAIAAARRELVPTRTELRVALITGASLLFGNTLVAWSTHLVPSGVSALIVSLSPAFMLGFDALLAGTRPSRFAVIGVAVGFAGLCLLVGPQWGRALSPFGMLLAFLGAIGWSFGTIYSRRFGGGTRLFLSVALQMLMGSALLAICALVLGEWRAFDPAGITAPAVGGLTFLIVGGLIAYCAYLYLAARAPTAVVSTYAYVNPIIAVFLGIWLFHERVSSGALVAIAVILAGVVCMVLPPKTFARRRVEALGTK